MTFTLAGLAIGLALAINAARATRTLFYGVQPDYVSAILVASLALLVAAGFACIVPARRASRTDRMMALKQE